MCLGVLGILLFMEILYVDILKYKLVLEKIIGLSLRFF